MRVKKIVLIILSVFMMQFMFSAQVQNLIGVVRPQFSEKDLKIKDEMKEMEDKDLKKKKKEEGEKTEEEKKKEKDEDDDDDEKEEENQGYDKKIMSYRFGSGFIYVGKDGTNYVITNHHVIEDYRYACIEFIDPDTKEKTLYEDLEVIALSEDIDLALLVFPKGKKPFKTGLTLFTGELKDGDHVYSAGYPALKDKPAWQIAKGNVSNAKFYKKQLVDPDYSYVVQHTAPIDAGNSGGPLLIENGKPDEYLVAGVNTWKAGTRELAAFTIPAETVQKFLNEYFNHENNEEKLKKRTDEFATNLSKKTKKDEDIRKFISMESADALSFKQIENLFKKYISQEWKIYNAINDLGSAKISLVTLNVWNKYKTFETIKDKNVPKLSVTSMEKNKDGSYKVVFEDDIKKNTIVSTWKNEMNLWVVTEISYTKDSANYEKEKLHSIDTDKSARKKPLVRSELALVVDVSTTVPMVAENKDAFYEGAIFQAGAILKYFGIDVGWVWQCTDLENYLFWEIGTSLTCVLNLSDNLFLNPYARVSADVCLTNDNPAYGFSWGAGFRILMPKWKAGLDVFYKDTYAYHFAHNLNDYHVGTIGIGLTFYNSYLK